MSQYIVCLDVEVTMNVVCNVVLITMSQVMLYVMLYGFLPLPDDNMLELLHKAKDQDIFFPEAFFLLAVVGDQSALSVLLEVLHVPNIVGFIIIDNSSKAIFFVVVEKAFLKTYCMSVVV